MPEELPPIPPLPVSERTWSKTTKTTYTSRGDGTMRKEVTVNESSSFRPAHGKDFCGSNGDNFLQAKLRPTGVKLDLAQTDGPIEPPHYK